MEFTFLQTARFAKSAAGLLSEDDLLALEIMLVRNPEAGSVIRHGHGLRKVRIAASGRGKRGGGRVIYLLRRAEGVIVLADIYEKNEKEDLTNDELKTLIQETES